MMHAMGWIPTLANITGIPTVSKQNQFKLFLNGGSYVLALGFLSQQTCVVSKVARLVLNFVKIGRKTGGLEDKHTGHPYRN